MPHFSWAILPSFVLFFALAPGRPASASEPEETPKRRYDGFVLYDYAHHVRPQEFNVSAGGGFNNFGMATWYTIPVAPDGLLPGINDQFNAEVGLILGGYREVVYWAPGSTYWVIAVSGGARWDFHVTQNWVPFALLKMAVNFGFGAYSLGWILPGGGIGVLYRINDDLRLRLEAGYPLGLSAGLTVNIPTL